jgi:hypothetical protein
MKIKISTLKEIENALGDFEICQTLGGGQMYLRFGYWQHVNIDLLSQILGSSIIIEEYDDHDDDCGYLFSYYLTESSFK